MLFFHDVPGHLKKFTLAIKHFRQLRRHTAQSIAMEEQSKRFSAGPLWVKTVASAAIWWTTTSPAPAGAH